MKFPFKTKKIGDCVAVLKPDGTPIKENRHTKVNYKGRRWSAARLSFCLNVRKIPHGPKGGKKAKNGLCCHTCNNGWCIRPSHLYIGSRSSNSVDFYATARGKQRSEELKTNSPIIHRSKSSILKSAKWHTGKKRSKAACRRISKSISGRSLSSQHKLAIGEGVRRAIAEGKMLNKRSTRGRKLPRAHKRKIKASLLNFHKQRRGEL